MIGRRAQLSHGGVCLLLRPAQFRAQGADRVGVLNSRLLYLGPSGHKLRAQFFRQLLALLASGTLLVDLAQCSLLVTGRAHVGCVSTFPFTLKLSAELGPG